MKNNRSKYKPYPSYKPTSIEWLGEIPEGWECRKTKFVSDFINGYAFDSELYVESGIPIIRIGDIAEEIDFGNVKRFHNKNLVGLDKFKVLKGDLLLALTGATIGKAFEYKSKELAYLNQRVGILRGKRLYQYFLKYFFYSYTVKETINYLCNGGAQENISKTQIGNIFIPLPPLPEQQTIAAFLDRETAKIDVLVEKEGKMIELLKEKRSALITKAVTKGLDPNVKLKPSGVECPDKKPTHWNVRKLKYSVSSKNIKIKNSNYKVALENIESFSGKFIESEISFEGEGISFDSNSVLYGKLRPYLCKVFLPNKAGICVSELLVLVPDNKISDKKFIFYYMLSYLFTNIISGETFGTKMPRADWRIVGNFKLFLPPLPEQKAIASFLDRETTKIDKLIEKIGHQIELLKEYRQSLITSAVTGKIDVSTMLNTSVREEVPPP
ncbi:Type-1 restriction enzyme EcoKI specificity protein [Candidatus Brocadiaceae bacterium B188]|nr:Type-1 restriction enzyme EcoKI specificity protein [Candidatus Brocadiaceae bacterium B188]